jgi:hypothetical protein
LWSTDYKTLEDKQELKTYIEYLTERLEDKPRLFYDKNKIQKILSDFYKIFQDMSKNKDDPQIYVTSFCENGDNKNLWEKFGTYSIGFDCKKLDELRKQENTEYGYFQSLFQRVVYYEKGSENIPNEFIKHTDEIINYLNLYVTGSLNNNYSSIEKLLVCIPLFKRKKPFKVENEYRLLVVTPRKSDNPIVCKTKVVKSGRVKLYIELFDDPNIILPIRKIIVGSSLDYEHEKKWIERLLKEKGLDNIVKISKSIL